MFRYFDVFETLADFGFFDGLPKIGAWRAGLAARPSVRQAVSPRYNGLLLAFILKREGAALARLAAGAMARLDNPDGDDFPSSRSTLLGSESIMTTEFKRLTEVDKLKSWN